MRWIVMLAMLGCGGTEPQPPAKESLDGCWNYSLSDVANASGQLQIVGQGGTFTLAGSTPIPNQPASGLLLVSDEPNGDVAFLFYTEANHLLLHVVNDKAAITGGPVLHFARTRC